VPPDDDDDDDDDDGDAVNYQICSMSHVNLTITYLPSSSSSSSSSLAAILLLLDFCVSEIEQCLACAEN